MAVSTVKINKTMTGSEKGVEQGIGTQRKATVGLTIECNSENDTTETILNYLRGNASYPSVGRVYNIGNTRNSGLFCRAVNVNRVSKSALFEVTAEFEPQTIQLQVTKQDGQGRPSTNPFTWRHEIQTSDYTITVPAESGTFRGYFPPNAGGNKLPLNGFTPVMNSALQRFDPPPEREVSIEVIRITKYVSLVFPHLYQRYKGSVNSDNVVINKGSYGFLYRFSQHQGKIKSINNVFDIANGIPYFKQTLELHVNPLGWRRFILDQGDDELFAAEEKMDGVTVSNSEVGQNGFVRRRVLDPRGNPVRGLLDGNGKLLKKGQQPVFLIYQIDNELPFAPIQW